MLLKIEQMLDKENSEERRFRMERLIALDALRRFIAQSARPVKDRSNALPNTLPTAKFRGRGDRRSSTRRVQDSACTVICPCILIRLHRPADQEFKLLIIACHQAPMAYLYIQMSVGAAVNALAANNVVTAVQLSSQALTARKYVDFGKIDRQGHFTDVMSQ